VQKHDYSELINRRSTASDITN